MFDPGFMIQAAIWEVMKIAIIIAFFVSGMTVLICAINYLIRGDQLSSYREEDDFDRSHQGLAPGPRLVFDEDKPGANF